MTSHVTSSNRPAAVAWTGVASTGIAALLMFGLLSRPMLFVGVVDIALPAVFAVAGIIAAHRGPKAARWTARIIGGLSVLGVTLAVAALMAG